MDREKKVPEIRFKGFDEEWDKAPLKEVSIINPKTDIPAEFVYVDLESVSGTEIISHRKEYKETAPSRAQRLASKGDIFYQTVRPYQKNNVLFDINSGNFVFSTGYAQIRPNKNIDNNFLFARLQEQNYVNEVLKRCTGTSYPAINSNDLSGIKIYLPYFDEQEKIGNLFSKLDQIITKQEQFFHTTKQFKKAMLQKMFPKEGERVPEIRFEGFQDKWIKVKIKDLFMITRGNVLAKSEIADEINDEYQFPVYSSQTVNDGLLGYYKEYLFENAITWTTDGANAGTVNYRKGRFYSTNVNGVLLSDEGYANKTISEILNSVAYRYVSKVGNPKLMNNVMSKIEIVIPKTIKEQIVISEFIDKIGYKIQLEEQKLENYKSLKQALLQRMFI